MIAFSKTDDGNVTIWIACACDHISPTLGTMNF